MKSAFVLFAIVSAGLVAACDGSASMSAASGKGSSSSSSAGLDREVTLSGESGHAELAGDAIDLKEGVVYVNGKSFGAVPAGALVKYTVTPTARVLTVGGEARTAAK